MLTTELSCRRTEHQTQRPGVAFDPGLGIDNLSRCLLLRRAGKEIMVQRMGADFEAESQLAKLSSRHRLGRGGHWHIECPGQSMPLEQLSHAKIQRMAVVPAGRDVGLRPHDNPARLVRWSTYASRTKS